VTEETLKNLYKEHRGKVSDRWSLYLSEYNRLFREYKRKPINLLEIGVQNGGSLEIWSTFFPDARRLVGCDINPDCGSLTFDDPRIAVLIGDADTDDIRERILALASTFDVIIDDGSHRSSDIARTFARYFPYLSDGGIFIVEDLHCSYWQEFEGGLFHPLSSIAFFKQLADLPSYEHWGINRSPASLLRRFFAAYSFEIPDAQLQHVHSVEFINSMCVVRKENPRRNRLGTRFIAGSVALVVPGHWELHGTESYALEQSANKWAIGDTRSQRMKAFLKSRVSAFRQRASLIRTMLR